MEHTRASFVLGHHQEQASVVCCQRGDTTLLVTDLTPFIRKAISGPISREMWVMFAGKAAQPPLTLAGWGPSARIASCSLIPPFRSNGG